LEVLIPKGDDVASGEWAGRLWWTVALGMPVVFLAMAPMFGLSVMTAAAVGCAEFLLSIPVVFWWGADVWKRGKGVGPCMCAEFSGASSAPLLAVREMPKPPGSHYCSG